MSEESISTRRSFLKGGALIAAPLAAVGAPAIALAADDSKERLARLEDEKAIRALHQGWMRHINSGDLAAARQLYANAKSAPALDRIASVLPDHSAESDKIAFTKDGRASATYVAIIETETLIAPDNTLTQMLHVQGEGRVRASERRSLKADYVRTRNGWAIANIDFTTA
jgi:hypothetical protein